MTVYDLAKSSIGSIKLGSKDGSGFIFCGKAYSLDVEKLNKRIISKNEKALAKAKSRYRLLRSKSVSFDEYARKNGGECRSVEGYHIFLDEHYKEVKTAYNTLITCADRVANYTDLAGREIVDSYKSIDEKDTTIVIYAGTEVGEAWTTQQYEEITTKKR